MLVRKDTELKLYWFVQDLSVQQRFLLYKTRLVTRELQKELLDRFHGRHQGIVNCRALARDTVG